MPSYDVEKLKTVLRYDPETGYFHWLIRTHGRAGVINVGDIAGTPRIDGYIQINYARNLYRAHILAWVFQTGELPTNGREIDHKNRKRADNRWDNLRLLKRGANNINSGKRGGREGVRGIYKTRNNQWFARITVSGNIIHLGTFINFEDAVLARTQAEERFWMDEERTVRRAFL